jgi:crooked neck
MSCGQFEMSSSEERNVVLARQVYEGANQSLCGAGEEGRVLLLEAWRDFEPQNGDENSLENVMQKMPRRVEKRQRIEADDGAEEGREEFLITYFQRMRILKQT